MYFMYTESQIVFVPGTHSCLNIQKAIHPDGPVVKISPFNAECGCDPSSRTQDSTSHGQKAKT